MLLKNLIKNISKSKKKIIISGLAVNSKDVKKNFIFFAIKGNNLNGENFIREAVKNGATVVICSKNCKYKNKKIIIIKTDKTRYLLSEIASKFYRNKPKNIIAVTGTNGKTSVADLFYQILRVNKIPVASIGTLGIKYNNKTIKTNLTSPNTIEIHKYLHYLKKKKIDNVIIEASSHGLDQKRLHNINFKAAVFTNFSQDHLDYHKNMNSYLNAKLILFKKLINRKSKIISDKQIQPYKNLILIAKKKKIQILNIDQEIETLKKFHLSLIGDFKIKNLGMAILAAKVCGLKNKLIYNAIRKVKEVSGRLELIKVYSNNIKVFIDYAHTPDALNKSLQSLRKKYGLNVILVFGCGGDRDKIKRPLMAKIANKNCKKIYLTDDNPRNENPKKIRNELSKSISKNKCVNIGNRALAIKKSIQNANPHDVILIAGKGHEEEQFYKNKIIKTSDAKIVKKLKIKIQKSTKKKQDFLQNKKIIKKILRKKNLINFNGLSIDSRTIKNKNLFLALKGKNNNGSNFIKEAFKNGASCAVTSSKIKEKKNIIKVKNSISFLNHFAKLKRDYSSAKIVAITGSAGKTSLKNLIRNILSNFEKTFHSPKSFNNHLGVPISLSNLSCHDKFGVFEVGMSKTGEIGKLSKLIRPHIGVITNVGEAHLENFKDIKGIAKAKSEIIENIEDGGTIILNRDNKFFNYLFKKAKARNLKISTFGKNKKSDVCFKKIIRGKKFSKIFIKVNNQTINFDIQDLNVANVLAAISVLNELKVDLIKSKSKFKNIGPSEGRGKKYSISRYNKKFKLIDESYNANPLSVKSAINRLGLIKKEKFKKYLILGDMLELGSKSKKYHEDLSKVINNSDIDKVFIKGKKTIFTYKYLDKDKRGNILQNIEDIDLSLSVMISNNDYLMIKGSNATGLNDFSKKMIRGI